MLHKAFTHGGIFHADDVFSAALLCYLYPDIQIERGFQVPENYDGIVFDIGLGKYDHHQEDREVRKNGIPYAAFGLLWREFGKDILGEEQAEKFDEEFVQPIDLADNTGTKSEYADIIESFNPGWDEEREEEDSFEQAKEVAFQILSRKFSNIRGSIRAEKIVKAQMSQAENHILVLEKFMPWKKTLIGSEVYFVIFPSKRGGYCAQSVPKSKDTHELVCAFPEKWRGKPKEQLPAISGIDTLQFCHNTGFMIAAAKKEDAVLACEIAMQNRGI